MKEQRVGLWSTQGRRMKYYNGRITLEGVTYWINLYPNDVQPGEKGKPDFDLHLREAEERPSNE